MLGLVRSNAVSSAGRRSVSPEKTIPVSYSWSIAIRIRSTASATSTPFSRGAGSGPASVVHIPTDDSDQGISLPRRFLSVVRGRGLRLPILLRPAAIDPDGAQLSAATPLGHD